MINREEENQENTQKVEQSEQNGLYADAKLPNSLFDHWVSLSNEENLSSSSLPLVPPSNAPTPPLVLPERTLTPSDTIRFEEWVPSNAPNALLHLHPHPLGSDPQEAIYSQNYLRMSLSSLQEETKDANSDENFESRRIWNQHKATQLRSPYEDGSSRMKKNNSWHSDDIESVDIAEWESEEKRIIENLGIDYDEETTREGEVSDPLQNSSSSAQSRYVTGADRTRNLVKLMEMGFKPALCIQALNMNNNDFTLAHTWLLANQNSNEMTKKSTSSVWNWNEEADGFYDSGEESDVSTFRKKRHSSVSSEKHMLPAALVPCKFYASGFCKYGDKCPFMHEEKVRSCKLVNFELMLNLQSESEEKPKKNVSLVCKFYAAGSCKKGDKCPYLHESKSTTDSTNGPMQWSSQVKVTLVDG